MCRENVVTTVVTCLQESKWEEWDPVGVVVEKHDSPTTVSHLDTPGGTPALSKDDEFFADIQPEIKAPPKVCACLFNHYLF